jgi:hypothetical protein
MIAGGEPAIIRLRYPSGIYLAGGKSPALAGLNSPASR